MIAATCFTKEWLDECRGRVGRIDPGLLEKSIYAFDLLGRMAAEGLPFVFKGGTALLLMLDNFRRLSIDVDIACGGALVQVGDVIVADDDGPIVIPPHLVEEVLEAAEQQEAEEEYITQMVREGHSVDGLYPLSGTWRERFEQSRENER